MIEKYSTQRETSEIQIFPNEIQITKDTILSKVQSALLKNGVKKVEVDELFKRYFQNTNPDKSVFGKHLQEHYRHFYQIFLEDITRNNKNQDIKFQLGDWLIFFGDISPEELEKALEYQKQYTNQHQKNIPLGRILVARGYISKQRLGEIGMILGFMKLGEYLVCHNIVNGADMAKSIKESINTNTLVGMILIEKKLISKETLYPILKKLKIIRTGEYFVYEEIITPEQLHIAQEIHTQTQKPLGEILLKQRFITNQQLNNFLVFMGKTPKIEELSLVPMDTNR